GLTAGRRALGLHVRSTNGQPLEFVQAAKRLLRLIAIVPFVPLLILTMAGAQFAPLNLAMLALSVVLLIISISNLFVAIRRGAQPWHDRWAGTEVVRVALTPAAAPQAPSSPAEPTTA